MGDSIRIGVFVYDFPHRRSNDFLVKIQSLVDIEVVLAAPYKMLSFPETKYRISTNSSTPIHPRNVCEALKVPYISVPHEQCSKVIKKMGLDIGIVAGARILPAEVIVAFKTGVINFHPGIIPENRGLDTVRWAIYRNLLQGVTAHWINERVDAGCEIATKTINVQERDTMPDISHKLYNTQIDLIDTVFNMNFGRRMVIDVKNYKPHTVMDVATGYEVLKKFEDYKRNYWRLKK